MQRHSARDQHLQVWRYREEIGYSGSGLRYLLKVVEQQQQLLIAQIVVQECMEWQASRLAQAKCLRNRGWGQGRVSQRGQRNKIDTVLERIEQLGSDLKPQAGFSDTTRTGEREQAHLEAAQEGADCRHLLLAPDQ